MNDVRIPRWGWMLFVAILLIVSLIVVFRLGNRASAGVSLNDPVVWVEDGARGQILQINGSTQEITASVRVGAPGDSLVAIPRGRDAVFLNRTTGELGVIGAVTLAVDSTEELGGSDGPLQGEHLEIKADFDVSTDAFILDRNRTLVYEPGGGERLDIPTPAGLGDSVIDAEGRLVAITIESDRIGITTERGLVPLVTLPVPIDPIEQPPGLARAGEDIYVVDAARRSVNKIVGTEELGPTVCVAGSLSNVRIAGNELSNSDGAHRVLVHDSAAGVLSVTEPNEDDCFQIELTESGEQWGDPVAVDSFAYLPNFETGRITIVDLEERIVLDTVRFGVSIGREFELEVFDGAVWANEPQGSRAAIIKGTEITQISKLISFRLIDNAEGIEDGFGGIIPGEGDDDRFFEGAGEGQGVGQGGDDEDPGGGGLDDAIAGGDQPGEGDLPEGELPADLENSPILVDVVQNPADTADQLVANFVFSADTVNVGEEVLFADESTGSPTSWNWDFGDGTGGEGPEVTKIWETEGLFTVTLFVANASGEQAQQSLEVTVVAVDVIRVPTADFSFRSDTVEVGESIEFVDESTGDPDTLLWSFGDGEVGAGSIVSHVFTEPGTFEVSLTASNEAGPNSTSVIITVVEGVKAPEAIIGSFPRVVEVGQSVTLRSESTNSPTAISWRFGDGDSALGSEVRHSWDTPGTFRIRLSVSNSAAADETIADIVVEPRVNPPTARFGQSSLEVVVGETISFNDLSLNSPTSLTWEFGDGATALGSNVSHTWDTDGSFTVTLTARNEAGSDDVAKTVTIIPLPPDPPNASFTVASATVPVNSVINFTDTSTGDATAWNWDFGDGTSSVAQSPPHGYSTPGTYEVTLTASNAGGSDVTSKTIVVIDPPIASFTNATAELLVSFTDTTVNDPAEWDWNFGDGTVSTAQNPVKAYAAAGSYTVTLISSNDAGTSAPFTVTVQVASRPTASFSVITGGLTAQFTDTSTGAPTAWAWDFGDGNTAAVQSPSHTYAAGGTYTVTLTATNIAGSNGATSPVTVALAPPVANFFCTVVGGGVSCNGNGSTGAASFSWSSNPAAIASSGTTTPNATFTYTASGDYDITLTVENAAGAPHSATQTITVTVPQPPGTPNITILSNNNGVVELSATATNNPTSWSWAAGGAPMTGGNTSSPTITYTIGGQKTVTATATNAVDSTSNSVTFTVTITPPAPVINSVSQFESPAGSVAVSASTSGGTPTSWLWTVGSSNEGTSSSANPTFTFNTNGNRSGTVVAFNGAVPSNSFDFTLNVSGIVVAPTINSINQTESPAGVVVVSTNTSGGAPTSWTWDMTGTGATPATSTLASPTFTFAANGSYSGTVRTSNAGGQSNILPITIVVSGFVVIPPPNANFTFTDLGGGVAQIFDASTAQPSATYVWNFGGGAQTGGTNDSPTVTFPADDTTYSVVLTVTDPGGFDSITLPVTVGVP